MSPPPVPSLGTQIGAVFGLSWVRLVRGKKLRVGIAAILLVVVAATIARYAAGVEDPAPVVTAGVRLGFFGLLVYLIPFLMTSGAIAEEVETRTFHYLASRPLSRMSLALGKYLAGVGMASALLVGGMLLLHLACFITMPTPMIDAFPDTLRACGAIVMLTILYGAICLFWGAVVPEAAGIVSALYLGVMEWGFGSLPFFLRFVSFGFFGGELAGFPRGGLLSDTVPEVATWVGAVVLPVGTLFWLGLAILVVGSSEYRFGKA